jgi:arsenate reductase-like glutaredoxin family protein
MLKKVISGGQTGVDRLGLEVARMFGIDTGGTAPKNFKTENGPDYTLRTIYGLIEDDSEDYNSRTEKNVIDSNGTVLFGNMVSPGSKNTIKFIKKHEKPYKDNPTVEELITFIKENDIKILNVAGNRGSKLNLAQKDQFRKILENAFKHILIENGKVQS